MTCGPGATDRVVVRVNGERVEVRTWTLWREAVAKWRPEAGLALIEERGVLVDARGEPVDPDGTVVPEGAVIFHPVGEA